MKANFGIVSTADRWRPPREKRRGLSLFRKGYQDSGDFLNENEL